MLFRSNLVWAPIEENLKGVSLSANWMWPAKNPGENARLYRAVKALSDFVLALGINVPTGKDSLSMTQKYKNGQKVLAPGTVIVTAAGEVTDILKAVKPVIVNDKDSEILYIDFSKDAFKLGGSSFAQIINRVGENTPDIVDTEYFKKCFRPTRSTTPSSLRPGCSSRSWRTTFRPTAASPSPPSCVRIWAARSFSFPKSKKQLNIKEDVP